jgi:hypothetical protein
MKHRNTLEIYDSLISSGIDEGAARCIANELGATGDLFATELIEFRDKMTEMSTSLKYIRWIGTGLILTFVPVCIKILLH